MGYLIGLAAVVALIIAAARWIRGRRELDLSSALDAPWWLWPLMCLSIYLFWKREAHKDLYSLCGWVEKKDDELVPSMGPARMISIRLDKGRFKIVIRVKRGFPQGDDDEDARMSRKMQVVNHAKGTMGLGPVDADWNFHLWRSYVVLTPRKVIPHEAPISDKDVAAAVAHHSTRSKFVPAIGRGDRPIVHDLDQDAPHVVLSASTVGGKSATLRAIGAQMYRHGANIVILDIKLGSHIGWACDTRTRQPLPGIHYAGINDDHDAVPEIAQTLVEIGRLAEHRNAVAKQMLLEGKTPRFDRIVVLFDEMNGTMLELKARKLDDAMNAYRKTLWMGRWVAINIIGAGQRLDVDAAGGGAARECFGLRMLAEYSQQTWNIVAPQADKIPCVPHKYQPGWCAVVYSRDAEEAQRVYFTDREAKAWALGDLRGHDLPDPAVAASIEPVESHRGDTHREPQWPVPGQDQQVGDPDAYNDVHGSSPVSDVVGADGFAAGGYGGPEDDAAGDVAGVGVVEGELAGPTGRGMSRGAQPVGDVLGGGSMPGNGSEEGGDSGGPHTNMVRLSGRRVNQNHWDVGVDMGREENHPTFHDGARPISPLSAHPGGFSGRDTPPPSMQAISAGNGISGNDGGIGYSTLREIAERSWCQYKPDTLERYSRTPLKQRLRFPDPVIPKQGRAPARWSEREMEGWCESRKSRESQKGYQPLVYFILPGGRGELRWGAIIKIGKTINLDRRLDEFANHPDDVIDTITCRSEDEMDRLEDELHDRYKRQRVYPNKEWFRVEGRLAKTLGVREEVST